MDPKLIEVLIDNYAQSVVEGKTKPTQGMNRFVKYKVQKR